MLQAISILSYLSLLRFNFSSGKHELSQQLRRCMSKVSLFPNYSLSTVIYFRSYRAPLSNLKNLKLHENNKFPRWKIPQTLAATYVQVV